MKKMFPYLSLLFLLILGFGCQEKPASGEGQPEDTAVDPAPNDQAQAEALIKHGAYMVSLMGCTDCHTPLKMTPEGPAPDMDRYLSGHPADYQLPPYDPATSKEYVLFTMNGTAAVGPWGTSFSANLTPDETGIGNWTEEQFTRAIREGKSKGMENGRPLLPPMPWQGYSQINDEDLKAVFAYLKSLKPVSNAVPAPIPPAMANM